MLNASKNWTVELRIMAQFWHDIFNCIELRGIELLQRMENVLKEKFGASITIPVKKTANKHFQCGQHGCPKISNAVQASLEILS